jgi:hypothetical protein
VSAHISFLFFLEVDQCWCKHFLSTAEKTKQCFGSLLAR